MSPAVNAEILKERTKQLRLVQSGFAEACLGVLRRASSDVN